jgi:hypothetical protein
MRRWKKVRGGIYGVIIGVLLLILYIFIFIPFIIPSLNSMFLDWLNSNPNMFNQSWCTTHYVFNATTNTFYNYTDCQGMDFRPLILFIWQFTMYFATPVSLILISLKLRK